MRPARPWFLPGNAVLSIELADRFAEDMSESKNLNASRICMLAGLADVAITLAAYLASHSAVLLADFLKTFLEFVAVLIAWLTLRRIERGNAHSYDYGMGKLENLSSLLVGILMIGSILLIVFNAVLNIIHPAHIGGLGVAIGLGDQVLYLGINAWLFVKTKRQAAGTSSPILLSQCRLLGAKALGNLFILICLLASLTLAHHHGAQYIDPIASLLIAASILFAARGIVASSIYDLLDRTLEEHHQLAIIRELTRHFHRYAGLHGIRSRKAGRHVFVEITLEFEAGEQAASIHKTAHSIRRRLERKIPNSHVTIALAGLKVLDDEEEDESEAF